MEGLFLLKEILTGRLHVQDRPERRLLLNTSKHEIQKIRTFSMEGIILRVLLPLLWFVVSTLGIYQIKENPNCGAKKAQHQSDHLFRRHVEAISA